MKLVRRSSLILTHDNSHFKTAAAADDFSVSSEGSTFSTSQQKFIDGPIIHLPFVQRRRQRRVQFDESQNVYHSNTVMTKDECQALWHSRMDMKNFKTTTRAIAVEIHRSEQANTAPNSYANVVLAAYDACRRAVCDTDEVVVSPLNNKEHRNLCKWMQVAVSRTGLDRSSIREIAVDRHQRRQYICNTVMEIQESLVFREDLDQVIRKASEAISRPSRLFARAIAQAQATTS